MKEQEPLLMPANSTVLMESATIVTPTSEVFELHPEIFCVANARSTAEKRAATVKQSLEQEMYRGFQQELQGMKLSISQRIQNAVSAGNTELEKHIRDEASVIVAWITGSEPIAFLEKRKSKTQLIFASHGTGQILVLRKAEKKLEMHASPNNDYVGRNPEISTFFNVVNLNEGDKVVILSRSVDPKNRSILKALKKGDVQAAEKIAEIAAAEKYDYVTEGAINSASVMVYTA